MNRTLEISDNKYLAPPDYLRVIISWLGGLLSAETSIIGDVFFYNQILGYNESAIINDHNSIKDYISYWFNRGEPLLIFTYGKGYKITKHESLSNSDIGYVQKYELNQYAIGNKNHYQYRKSICVECTKTR